MNPLLHIHGKIGINSLAGIIDVLTDAVIDTLKILPFLFIAFLFIEFLEHKAEDKVKKIFTRAGGAGPAVAAVLGCIPQCGFSVLCANLYSGGIIALGTLIAVFLSTSDEAVILLAASSNGGSEIIKLLVSKTVIALVCGYTIYFMEKRKHKNHCHSHDLCDRDRCGCHDHGGVLRPALIHTAKIFGFLLLFSVIIDFIVALIGTENLSHLLLSDSVFQPLLSAIMGFIPNCASSVLLTQLYIESTLSFGSLVAGLCTNAGAGMLILLRDKSKVRENLKILGILYLCAVIPGIILHII